MGETAKEPAGDAADIDSLRERLAEAERIENAADLDLLRDYLREEGPQDAAYALFAPNLVMGAHDPDQPEACMLWGFDLASGHRLEPQEGPVPKPSASVLELLSEGAKLRWLAEYQASLDNPPETYQGQNMREWLHHLSREAEEAMDEETDYRSKIFACPQNYQWDGEAGQVSGRAPSVKDTMFTLRRLKVR